RGAGGPDLLPRPRLPRDHVHSHHAAGPLVAGPDRDRPQRPSARAVPATRAAGVLRVTTAVATVACHAKVNLLLRVLAREDDGYHGIETLFCLVDLADQLVVERRDERGVTIDGAGADVGPPDDNLAVRAARLVLDATGQRFGVHLRLEKRIGGVGGRGGGAGGGPGGLGAVNRLAGGAVPRHELLQF